ncbi:hypothetical protein IVB30_31305 [Bradyrhizobium sp. 200]|uniref:hypothetical protein n=1 Tax=Bradyrhizobium sp. 200 TaxID=2782665 RepID=UPI001FFF793E|nr:hypothetical protein [Bradyrhizobium sp. 200]UPJ47707.1 hypothetical protein IVB30_31305 [Bradyrhizobium sp. 200]
MAYTYLQIFLPYALIALKDGSFLAVNRKYKPLGISSSEMIDYDSHPTKVKIKGLMAAKAAKLGLKVREGATHFYLYDDGTNPERSAANWNRYQGILAKLMKLTVSSVAARR